MSPWYLLTKRLSRVIQQMRESKGMTQRDLAARAKVTPGYIAQIAPGKKKNPLPGRAQADRQGPRRARHGVAGVRRSRR
jgi:ribosome-binding protein aMBF1 (putative translation factor)